VVLPTASATMDRRIVIGLGTGRSGTGSLAVLLSAQRDSICFHEMNPSCARFFGTPRPILNGVEEFERILAHGDPSMVTVDLTRREGVETYGRLCRMTTVRMIGDVASYYLPYVRLIAARHPQVRFLCMRRDIGQTVQSWMEKTRIKRGRFGHVAHRIASLLGRTPYFASENFWMEHAGTTWQRNRTWDKLFPKFEASSKEDAIRQFCEYYYEQADGLAANLGANFRFVELERLVEPAYQSEVLSFAGIPPAAQLLTNVHVYNY
jgi:hypothetical protein